MYRKGSFINDKFLGERGSGAVWHFHTEEKFCDMGKEGV